MIDVLIATTSSWSSLLSLETGSSRPPTRIIG
jgi:hypothetical protein